MPSSLSSTPFQSERTPSGSGGISRSAGQRDIASPSRIPRTTPNASAAAETSPTTCSRPASGASATGSGRTAPPAPPPPKQPPPPLGRKRARLGQQPPPVPQPRKQLESWVEDADDHDRTHVRIRLGRLQDGSRPTASATANSSNKGWP